MNRTTIEWTDFTWNPVTGCYHGCEYCYARRVAERFYPKSVGFKPYFWRERLLEPQQVNKPSRIFVCSMADLFGSWVPWEWIKSVLTAVEQNPQHTFQFLTKNPTRYQEFNPWPSNCWIGTTITNQADADKRVPELLKAEAPVRFMSAEPMLGPMDLSRYLCLNPNPCTGGCESGICENLQWAIIGAMTGPGAVKPDPNWVKSLIDQIHLIGIPVFCKDNLNLPSDLRMQEFPTIK